MIELARRRSRHRVRGLIVAGGLAAAVAVGQAEPGYAVTSVEAGWWMAPVAVAPDAPADGLVVQGGVAGEVAFGAVHFALAPDEFPESLLLRVAPDSATTPNTTLALCPLTEPFTPAQGGAMADAPAYDCERSVEAEPSDDGTTYTVEVATLIDDGALAVAILPTAATDRVVLSAPGTYSLTAADTAVTPPDIDTSPPAPAPSDGSLDLPATPAPVGGAPTFPPVETPTPDTEPSPVAEPPLAAAPAAQSGSSSDGSWLRPLLFLGLAAAAAVLWGAAGAGDEASAQLAA